MEITTSASTMSAAGMRFLIGIDPVSDFVDEVLCELYKAIEQKARESQKIRRFEAAESLILHAQLHAIGAGIAIGKHIERKRRKAAKEVDPE